MVDKKRLKLFIINDYLETSNSDDEIEDMLCIIKKERPKVKNYVNIVNELGQKVYNYILIKSI